MNWHSLEHVWKSAGRKNEVKVRFNDWGQQIKYFVIMGETEDGKRFVGKLDSGEKMSFSRRSRGWSLYHHDAEFTAKAV